MNVFKFFQIIFFAIVLVACNSKKSSKTIDKEPKVSSLKASLVIDSNNLGSQDNLYGFEGGDVKKIGDTFHLVINERYKELVTTNNRFGYWQSTNGKDWNRKHTLLTMPYDTIGNVPNACIYNPKFIYSERDSLWNLYYIQFKSEPSRKGGWYKRYDGKIILCQSKTKGLEGISGPYHDGKCIFETPQPTTWEGLQGITGFAPYKVGNKWYALYGSATTQNIKNITWKLGLASADALEGPWTPALNHEPLKIPFGAESPVVYKKGDTFLAIIDEVSGKENFALFASNNGLDWEYVAELSFLNREKWNWKEIRMPVGFFEDNGKLHTYFTTYQAPTDFAPLRHLEFSYEVD